MRTAIYLLLTGMAMAQPGMARELSEADFLADLPPVLTASRLAQPLMDAPNSITLIDRKQIEASGYHNLSDLFRLVPGMYVGQKTGWFHNVTHTLADEYARRMQVLVDGRSVYLPSIGGVRWDALPVALDDIERIEVARGPNAASFGANALTGVINIITRHPDDVRGRMLHFVAGDHAHAEAWFRWAGGGEGSSHRVTLGQREDGGFSNQYDDERSRLFSYRGDFVLDGRQSLRAQLNYLDGTRGAGEQTDMLNQPHSQDVGTYALQLDYRRELSDRRELLIKTSFDHWLTREQIPVLLPSPVTTFPVVPAPYYQRDLLSERWHGEFQVNSDHADGRRSSLGGFARRDAVRSMHYWNTPDTLSATSWGAFGHLEWRLSPEWLLNMGAFWEDYELVDARLSPRLTVHWQPSPRHGLRFGVSRAYRNPVLFETHANWSLRLLGPGGAPVQIALPIPPFLLNQAGPYILSGGNVRPEETLSHEIAYLGQWPELAVSLDVRLFHERISDFINAECAITTRPSPCGGLLPLMPRNIVNAGDATQRGLEGQAKWQATADTQVLANFAFLDIDSGIDEKRYSPNQLYGLHLLRTFPGKVDLTLSHYWVPAFKPIGQGSLKPSRRLDARLAKRFRLDGMDGQIALTWESLAGSYVDFANDLVPGTSTPFNLFDSRTYVHFQLDF